MEEMSIDQFIHSPRRFCLLSAPRASGKTTALIRRGLIRAQANGKKPLFVSWGDMSARHAKEFSEHVAPGASDRIVFVGARSQSFRGIRSDALWDEAQIGTGQRELLQRLCVVAQLDRHGIDITITDDDANYWGTDSIARFHDHLEHLGVIAHSGHGDNEAVQAEAQAAHPH